MTKTRAASRRRAPWPRGGKLVIDLRGVHPVPKGSMRGFVVNGRAVLSDSKSKELRALERDLREIASREMDVRDLPCAHEQPFELLIVFYLPRPGGDFDKHGEVRGTARATPWTKPDLSKLERALEDAMTGMCFDDDARIVRKVSEKRYATKERDIGLWVELRVLPATMREVYEDRQTTVPLLTALPGGVK